MRNPKVWWKRWCSTAGLITLLSSVMFVVLLIAGVVSTQVPAGYSILPATTQMKVVRVAEQLDPFFYSLADIKGDAISVASLNCLDLKPLKQRVHSQSIPNLTRNHGNVPIQLLWNHSYFAKGSSLNLTINITDPPSNGVAPVLYQLNNWHQYNSWVSMASSPSHYIARYPVNKTGITAVVVNASTDDFYFFMLYLPDKITFHYEFWLDRLYYSPADYEFTCNTTVIQPSCQLSLPISASIATTQQCLLVLADGDGQFSSVSTTIQRRSINSLSLSLLLLMVLMVVVALSSAVYPWVQPRLGPWCTRQCHMCHRGGYKELT